MTRAREKETTRAMMAKARASRKENSPLQQVSRFLDGCRKVQY